MIELISETRCIACNLCVPACPVNVFEVVPDAPPRIARQEDCQTCFMCELYCPVDALYVSPNANGVDHADEAALEQAGLLGGYRKAVGWSKGSEQLRSADQSFRMLSKY
ncbi:ferredoxin family protein [Uliginosibacterium sp. H3]|uniref:Ferredoxin family protein n=1 Tax=Uliginosibacterium silvisoli TaxID=3114758 RepID=A0ABU6K735_9RHOO|nr:ferredoxin family protein [Uliginosibacterium sp. H3]